MDLPPPWYALLLGSTLLAYPFLLRAAADAHIRRLARRLVLALALLELALILLNYSVTVCWVLAGTAATWLAASAHPQARRTAAVAAGAVSLAAGLFFEFLPGELGFLSYFTLGLPLMFGPPLVAVATRWLRWDQSPTTLGAAILLLGFAGSLSASAFAQDFLVRFEISHLPATLLALAALGWMLGQGSRVRDQARADALRAMDAGEYAARAPVGATKGLAFSLVSTAAALAGAGALILVGPQDLWLTGGVIVLTLAGAAGYATRSPRPMVVGGLLQFLAALLIPITPAFEHYLNGQDATLAPFLVACAAAATAALVAASIAWARLLDSQARRDVLAMRERVPPTYLHHVQARPPEIPDLEALATDVRGHGAPGGILTVNPPQASPLWTLSDDVYAWLSDQEPGLGRVHVAILEGGDTFHVPPIAPEEQDA